METILRSVFDLWEKVPNEEALIHELSGYQSLLSDKMYQYLESLLEDSSVLKDWNYIFGPIDNNDREKICGIDIYRKLAIYNIYHNALRIFEKEKDTYPIIIGGNDKGIEGLKVEGKVGSKIFSIFDYDYSMALNTFDRIPIPNGCKVTKIGDVHIYTMLDSREQREELLHHIMNKLDSLYEQKNPFINCGNREILWNFKHQLEINEYEKLFQEVNQHIELTDEEMEQAMILKHFAELILKSYGLHSEFNFEKSEEIGNEKVLTKSYPGASVSKHIRYL